MTGPLALAVVERPNGKTYRAKKPPSVEEYVDHEDCTCIVVIRTHDVDLATTLAANEIRSYDLDPANAYRSWWRLVPFNLHNGHDQSYVDDPERGMPCVVIPYEF